jgi:hypothetical protein
MIKEKNLVIGVRRMAPVCGFPSFAVGAEINRPSFPLPLVLRNRKNNKGVSS